MTKYEPTASLGPNIMTEKHKMTSTEKDVFDLLLRPDDSYDSNGKYWGDMGTLERIRFVWGVDKSELKRETGEFGNMFRHTSSKWNGILAPIGWILGVWKLWTYYFYNCVIPGMGLLLEGYAYDNLLRYWPN